MTSFAHTNKKNIVLFMDPSTEIDDEILAYILMQKEDSNAHVFFVCVPGITAKHNPSATEIEDQVQRRIQRMRDVFPDRFGNTDTWNSRPNDHTSSVFMLCSYNNFQTAVAANKTTIDTLLHVAPLWHIPASSLATLNINQRIFMGDLSDPSKSINGTKAMFKGPQGDALRQEFVRQEEIFSQICKNNINIPTSFARQVPTPVAFINALPETMKKPLLNTAFSQFVGRPDPSKPWAEDISFANHETIINMLSKKKMYEILSQPTEERLVNMVIAFLKPEIERREALREKPFGHFYPLRLGQIATAVEHITHVHYIEPVCDSTTQFQFNTEVDSLENSELARKNWLKYISENNCDLTPFYDGLAWIFMKELEHHNTLPNVERCKQVIRELNTIPI